MTAFEGKHIGFYANFDTKEGEEILLKSGISFTSVENAEANLLAEMKGWDFDEVHTTCSRLWDDALAKVKIEGGSENEKTVFYTALYHTLIDPRICSDVNGEYRGSRQSGASNRPFREAYYLQWLGCVPQPNAVADNYQSDGGKRFD